MALVEGSAKLVTHAIGGGDGVDVVDVAAAFPDAAPGSSVVQRGDIRSHLGGAPGLASFCKSEVRLPGEAPFECRHPFDQHFLYGTLNSGRLVE